MAKSFIKWVGGKTRLVKIIDSAIGKFRENSSQFIYVEPFVGSGAVLFHLLETCTNLKYAIINDSNSQLMNCYRVIADNSKYVELKKELVRIQTDYNGGGEKEEKYNLYRDQYNEWINGESELSDVQGAAIFMFLNKCGFSGLYRVNHKNKFNTSWSGKEYLKIFDDADLDKCHVLLSEKVIIMNGDYSVTDIAFEYGRKGDCDVIYYLDPPYKPISDTSNFTRYTKEVFDDEEQERLKKFCDGIVKRGGNFVLSNSKCGDYFDKLYEGYNIETVSTKRSIKIIDNKRIGVEEIIITSDENKR